jgi:hypothetical protein
MVLADAIRLESDRKTPIRGADGVSAGLDPINRTREFLANLTVPIVGGDGTMRICK